MFRKRRLSTLINDGSGNHCSDSPSNFWQTIETKLTDSLSVSSDRSNLWSVLKSNTDPSRIRPKRVENYERVKMDLTKGDETFYVIRNLESNTYLKLSEGDLFLWDLMDGQNTIKDLALEFFLRYNRLRSIEQISTLVLKLAAGGFLCEKPSNIFESIKNKLFLRTFSKKFDLLLERFLRGVNFKNADDIYGWLYAKAGWFLFTKPMIFVYWLVFFTGLACFATEFSKGKYALLRGGGSYSLSILQMILINFLIIIIHESAHALCCKSYGRRVLKAGIMVYFGMPAYFVDTTDIWMASKKARISVSWAGPFSGMILGGLCSISLLLFPNTPVNLVLFRTAFICYFGAFFNLNPLLELDGYYVLMDYLEIPCLRKKSLEFVSRDFWPKILHRETFSKEEKLLAVFGLLSALWSVVAIAIAFKFWHLRASRAFFSMREKSSFLSKVLLGVLMTIILLPFILGILKKLIHFLVKGLEIFRSLNLKVVVSNYLRRNL